MRLGYASSAALQAPVLRRFRHRFAEITPIRIRRGTFRSLIISCVPFASSSITYRVLRNAINARLSSGDKFNPNGWPGRRVLSCRVDSALGGT
jgi:hypothetical protein